MKTILEKISSLREPAEPAAPGGGGGSMTGAAPVVSTNPGGPGAAAPAADDIYGSPAGSAPDGADGGNGEAPDFTDPTPADPVDPVDPVVDPLAVDPNAPADGTQPAPKANPQPMLKLDPESIAALTAARTAAPAAGEDPRKAEADLRAMLNPVEVTPELLQGMGFAEVSPEQVQGFQTFANATVRNAVSIAKVLLERKEREFMDTMQPLVQAFHQQKREEAQGRFYKNYPHLKTYDRLVKVAAKDVVPTHADGRGKTEVEIFKELAAATISTLTSMNVKVTPPIANPSAGAHVPVPKPNGLSTPGRSNGGGTPLAKPNNPDADIYARNR